MPGDRSLGYYLGCRFQTPSLLGGTWLDYPGVNPPVHVFLHDDTFTSFVDAAPVKVQAPPDPPSAGLPVMSATTGP